MTGSGPIPFHTVLPAQMVEENLQKGDCTFPFQPQRRWKQVFCFVSRHALDSNSYVGSRKKKKEVGKTGSLELLEDDCSLCGSGGGSFAGGRGWV